MRKYSWYSAGEVSGRTIIGAELKYMLLLYIEIAGIVTSGTLPSSDAVPTHHSRLSLSRTRGKKPYGCAYRVIGVDILDPPFGRGKGRLRGGVGPLRLPLSPDRIGVIVFFRSRATSRAHPYNPISPCPYASTRLPSHLRQRVIKSTHVRQPPRPPYKITR